MWEAGRKESAQDWLKFKAEANLRKQNGTETSKISNGSTQDIHADNLSHTFSRSSIKKDEEENVKMQYCWWLLMD